MQFTNPDLALSQGVEMSDGNPFPSDRTEFLTKHINKERFTNSLARELFSTC